MRKSTVAGFASIDAELGAGKPVGLLEDKTALVAGGSTGIGLAAAVRLAARTCSSPAGTTQFGDRVVPADGDRPADGRAPGFPSGREDLEGGGVQAGCGGDVFLAGRLPWLAFEVG